MSDKETFTEDEIVLVMAFRAGRNKAIDECASLLEDYINRLWGHDTTRLKDIVISMRNGKR